MLKDIFNKPQTLILENKIYKMEFDNTAYAMVEENTGKSIFQLYDDLIGTNSLNYENRVELVCCSLLKHHNESEIKEARAQLTEHKYLMMKNNMAITVAFMIPLTPPELLGKQDSTVSKKKTANKKTLKKTKS